MWHRHSWHSTAISCKALHNGMKVWNFLATATHKKGHFRLWMRHLFLLWHFHNLFLEISYNSYPGIPPDSILLAKVTSSLQTSNCHLRKPMTPQSTLPVWTPIRMSTLVCVISRTALKAKGNDIRKFKMNACLAIAHSSALLRVSGLLKAKSTQSPFLGTCFLSIKRGFSGSLDEKV